MLWWWTGGFRLDRWWSLRKYELFIRFSPTLGVRDESQDSKELPRCDRIIQRRFRIPYRQYLFHDVVLYRVGPGEVPSNRHRSY
ncbi:hypothetical protein DACRYDRAFT_22112 [Dacryopinax primogenitus]|uniref:Uncharacterized protein n=1 Tax=Dacryopinax primogenitus (strain DJM 731) TaxID=1858805 RepID=M5GDK2_DACPD|nr:uncharacterized protein DACRYDRAFT_22112 [Dacryopinax primogenitus]EJU02478.1 hypothetical protein DACRYDRAFT_22112 [Dacryopinax primogenitus]